MNYPRKRRWPKLVRRTLLVVLVLLVWGEFCVFCFPFPRDVRVFISFLGGLIIGGFGIRWIDLFGKNE